MGRGGRADSQRKGIVGERRAYLCALFRDVGEEAGGFVGGELVGEGGGGC